MKSFTRYLLVGLATTALDFGLFVALVHWGWPKLAAHLACVALILPLSFFGQRVFAFRSLARMDRQAVEFLAVTLSNVFLVQPLVLLAVPSAPWGKVSAIVIGVTWNFLWFNLRVFRA